jgi:subtilisin family serine protease
VSTDSGAAQFDVFTTTPTDSYRTICGTSFAAPHVAGAALIVRAAHPTWTNADVAGNLVYTAQHVGGAAYDSYTGHGMVRADLAAGVWPLTLTASLASGHARLSWNSEPLPNVEYRIYRRVFLNGVGGDYELWATTTSTTWNDPMASSSLFGYGTWPASGYAVNYHVVAASPDGYETSWVADVTFIPVGIPPQ